MIGRFLPEATGLATVFVAQNPHGYWRRDPESNRADRICNPDRNLDDAPKYAGTLRKRLSWGALLPLICTNLPDFYQRQNQQLTPIASASRVQPFLQRMTNDPDARGFT